MLNGHKMKFSSTVPRILLILALKVAVEICSSFEMYEKKLRDELFHSSRHDSAVRPVVDPTQPVNISFGVHLSKLVELNTKRQLLVTDAWVTQKWINPFLTWNESQYGGVHSIHILPDKIWVPDTVLYNNGDESSLQEGNKFNGLVILQSNGLCSWLAPTAFKSSCNMDITNFPFDTQTCEMSFGSWAYDNRLLRMEQLHTEHVNAAKYFANGDWSVRHISIHTHEIKYPCCQQPYSEIIYTFVLDRKPSYHVLYLIAPCVIISFLSLLTFYLPPDCGERVGLSITTLLAMSVYLLIVSDIIPETSDYVPKLGIYYIAAMVLVAGSLAATAITLRCHYNRHKPPDFLVRLFSCKAVDIRRVKSTAVVVEDLTLQSNDDHVTNDVIADKKKTEKGKGGVGESEKLREEWKDFWLNVAKRLDGFFLVAFFVIYLVVNMSILFSRD